MHRVYYKGTFTNKTTKLQPILDETVEYWKWNIIRVQDRFALSRRPLMDKKDVKSNRPKIGRKNRKDAFSEIYFNKN